jgi:hypothetical protein
MKRRIWMFVAASSLMLSPLFGQSKSAAPWTFRSSEGDYVLTLPAGWRQITVAEFDAQEKLFKGKTGNPAPKYDVGFQLANREPFEYPYIFVQHGIRRPMPFDDLRTQVNSQMLSDVARESSKKAAAVIAPMQFTAIHPFEERRIIVADFESTSDDESAMKGMTAYCAGRQGVVNIHFYALKSNHRKYATVFQEILDSFRYLPGYEYQEVSASSPTTAPPADTTWDVRSIVSKGIAFVVLAAIWGFFRGRKKSA